MDGKTNKRMENAQHIALPLAGDHKYFLTCYMLLWNQSTESTDGGRS